MMMYVSFLKHGNKNRSDDCKQRIVSWCQLWFWNSYPNLEIQCITSLSFFFFSLSLFVGVDLVILTNMALIIWIGSMENKFYHENITWISIGLHTYTNKVKAGLISAQPTPLKPQALRGMQLLLLNHAGFHLRAWLIFCDVKTIGNKPTKMSGRWLGQLCRP